MILPKKERSIETPEGGWKEKTFYAVLVAVNSNNPIWGAVFYSGFLDSKTGEPGSYASAWSGGAGSAVPFDELHFLEILHELNVPDAYFNENDLKGGKI